MTGFHLTSLYNNSKYDHTFMIISHFNCQCFQELVIMLHQFNSLEVVFDICWTFFLRSSLYVITSYFIALLF